MLFDTATGRSSGDVTGGGTFHGTVTSSDAWIQSTALDGDQVNFWSFSANAGDVLSIVVESSAIDFGVSVYQGVVEQMELFIPGFSNYGDFGDNVFVAGTNPVTGAIGTVCSTWCCLPAASTRSPWAASRAFRWQACSPTAWT